MNSFLNVPATDLRPVMVRDGDECQRTEGGDREVFEIGH